ncbi:MAG TPA: hypothetical protein VF017_10620 [Thermoanaerobaculia bacterium]|nr:hypothetical protein [Thermoanaerobaculia bacterium]
MRYQALVLTVLGLLAATTVGAQPFPLDIAILPEQPTSRELVTVRLTGSLGCMDRQILGPYRVFGTEDLIELHILCSYCPFICPPNPPEVVDLRASLGPLPAGTYHLRVTLTNGQERTVDFAVREPEESPELRLQEGRFRLMVSWEPPEGGAPRHAIAQPLGDQAGTFWFFDEDNIEVTVKLLDGRAVNDRFWLFVASMTDVAFRLSVMDVGDGTCLDLPVFPPDCPNHFYDSLAGVNTNIIDVNTLGGVEP